MTDEAVDDRNKCEKEAGKTRFVREISKTSHGNVLGALFWSIYMVRKDTGFAGELIIITMVKWQVKSK